MTIRRHKIALLLAPLALAASAGACGQGDGPRPVVATAEATVAAPKTPSTDTSPTNTRPSIDPTTARACDGRGILCVDAAAGASSPDGSAQQPFVTVTRAIGAAQPGAVIQVAKGTYRESLTVSEVEGLSIVGGFRSKGDFSERDATPDETVVEADGDTSVVTIAASNQIHIEGLRLTGGGGDHSDGSGRHGGGVDIDETSTDVTIIGNRIDSNAVDRDADPTDSRGGGVYTNGKRVSIVGNIIERNRAGRGAGVAAAGETLVEGNTVRDNVSVGDHGGGLYLAGQVVAVRNQVIGNRVGTDYSWGGGILVFNDGTEAMLQGNVVTGNKAITAGSGVFVDDGTDATLRNELYYANECGENGGDGLYVDSGGQTPTVVDAANVTIADHDCQGSRAHGLAAETSQPGDPAPQVALSNSILWRNGEREVEALGADLAVTFSLSEARIEGEGNVTGDPMFVDPPNGDFHLRSSSPAIDAGSTGASLGHTGNTPEARSAS